MLLRRIINLFRPVKVTKANIYTLTADQRLQGKRIVVTGGTGAIGQAMAKRFVTRVEAFSEFLSQSVEKLGGLDCLVNNAGVSLHETFQTVTPEGFDQQVATNLKGPFFLSQRALDYMEKQGVKGHVLFISSETGDTADIRPYGLTKAAVNSLVQGLAYLYADQGIRVNALAPGVTASAMTGFAADGNLTCSYNVNGRVYLPEEMAEVAAFLLSDASGCISGQIITCNNANTINARWKSS